MPPPLPGLLWDGLSDRTLIAAALLAAVGVIVAIVVTGSGGGGAAHTTPFVGTLASQSQLTTPTESTTTPTESTTAAAAATVESATVETVLNEYQSDYSNEDIEALKGLFTSSLVRQDGSHKPEVLSQAMATYQHQFSELSNPSYTLSGLNIEPGPGDATAKGNTASQVRTALSADRSYSTWSSRKTNS